MSLLNIVLALLSFATATNAHECIHDKIVQERGPIGKLNNGDSSPNEPLSRLLQSWTWRPIRILTDWSTSSIGGTALATLQYMFTEHILPRIQSAIQVQGPTTIAAFKNTGCDKLIHVPTKFTTKSTDTDLILMMTSVNNPDEDYLAYATACSLDGVTGRPNVGMVAINIANTNLTDLQKEIFTYTIIHEIHHILIMSPDLWSFFYQVNYPVAKNVTISSKNGTSTQVMVVSPSVVSYGAQHFACPSFPGVPMENQGGSGSIGTHWEKVFMGNELMTSQMTGKPAYSQFTLALMADSGWYKVNYNQADEFNWGKGAGCGFYDFSCSTNYREFCPKPVVGNPATYFYCSKDYTSKAYCIGTDFTDNCYIKEYMSDYNCNFQDPNFSRTTLYESPGHNSRCFITNYNNQQYPGCYPSACSGNTIVLTVNGRNVTCGQAGTTVSVGSVTIVCPNPSDFCSYLSQQCLNDCSGNGRCMNGGCFCNLFYDGTDCSINVGCGASSDVCAILATTTSLNGTTNRGTTNPFSATRLGALLASLALLVYHLIL